MRFPFSCSWEKGLGVEGDPLTGTTTTIYIGNYFEWTVTEAPTATTKTYYYAGAVRIAMRTNNGDPQWLLGDHLGSTSLVYDGTATVRQGYMPWGEQRFVDGAGELPTTFRFTGQREEAGIGLYFYGARWYDAALGRFVQADTVIPGSRNPNALDRYLYAFGNPLIYIDPSGHIPLIDGLYDVEYATKHADEIEEKLAGKESATDPGDLSRITDTPTPYPPTPTPGKTNTPTPTQTTGPTSTSTHYPTPTPTPTSGPTSTSTPNPTPSPAPPPNLEEGFELMSEPFSLWPDNEPGYIPPNLPPLETGDPNLDFVINVILPILTTIIDGINHVLD
jgi:RHS repeat-associated protein